MKKVYTMGEALIDFVPVMPLEGSSKPGLSLPQFIQAPGGAPANVAAVVSLLGGKSAFIGKLGDDVFGHFLRDTLKHTGVSTEHLLMTQEAKTGLAFVNLAPDGNRSFSFYRNPSADLLLTPEEALKFEIDASQILHFCSVDLVPCPTKEAHDVLIDAFIQKGGLVVFDPNVRLPLWPSAQACRETICDYIPRAHILKISDDELEMITQLEDETEALNWLFQGQVQAIIYTRGKKGASLYFKDGHPSVLHVDGIPAEAVDTTGAGDAFIGAFLFKLSQLEHPLTEVAALGEALSFANAIAAKTVTEKGAISAYLKVL